MLSFVPPSGLSTDLFIHETLSSCLCFLQKSILTSQSNKDLQCSLLKITAVEVEMGSNDDECTTESDYSL